MVLVLVLKGRDASFRESFEKRRTTEPKKILTEPKSRAVTLV